MPKAKQGMRVRVFSPKGKHWGLGTIRKVGILRIRELGIKCKNYPFEIVLDNGKVTEGMKCYWYPED